MDLNELNYTLELFDSTKEQLQVLHNVSTSKCNAPGQNLAVIAPKGVLKRGHFHP